MLGRQKERRQLVQCHIARLATNYRNIKFTTEYQKCGISSAFESSVDTLRNQVEREAAAPL
jgi:hypothetical protein